MISISQRKLRTIQLKNNFLQAIYEDSWVAAFAAAFLCQCCIFAYLGRKQGYKLGERSKLTTLCYIEKGDSYLMLHRVSKKHDVNKDKWIGIGGHFEENESPEECLLREAKEETGLTLTSWKFRGIVTFISEGWNTEYMCLYTADGYEGEIIPCNEGVLEWIRKEDLLKLNLWEGDKIFLKLLQENAPFFSLKLAYKGDVLTEAVLDGKKLKKS